MWVFIGNLGEVINNANSTVSVNWTLAEDESDKVTCPVTCDVAGDGDGCPCTFIGDQPYHSPVAWSATRGVQFQKFS
jgi:hypothetical protein